MQNKRILTVITLIAYFIMLYVNYLSGTGKINNIAAGEVSALYPTLFTPAGFTFSIWGLIYFFGFLYVLQLIWMAFRGSGNGMLVNLSWYYLISCVINIAWIYAWHYDWIGLALLLMLALLYVLITLYRIVTTRTYPSIWEYITLSIPISLYLGWITIATVANTAVWLTAMGWDGSPMTAGFWTSLMVLIAAGINLFILFRKRDVFFALVYLWAAYGIIIARSEGQMLAPDLWISRSAIAGMVLVFLGMLYARFVRIQRNTGQ